jgi:hypothetical protein
VKITRALFLVLAATLAGCNESTEPETVGISGSLSFSYTGAGAATATQYSATGAIPSNFGLSNGTQAWAAGGIDAANNATIVYAFVPKGGNTWDQSFIKIDRTTAGTSTISASCTANNCTEIGVWFGMNQNGTNYTYICTLTSGTVNISAISATTASGTFSGSGTCAVSGSTTPTSFTITNGSFNVGLTTLID